MAEEKDKAEESEKSEQYKLETSKINWKNGFTVYEAKMSVLIIGAIVSLVFALVCYWFREDISNNLTSIVETFILCIAGITTAETAISMLKDKGIFGNKK